MAELTRREQYLAAIAGEGEAPESPITREEQYLQAILDNGGGGGGGGGESTIAWKPTVDANGNISWNRTSSTTKPATQNIKGAKGDKGDKGDTGATGEKGEDGAKGDKGDKGDTGEQGAKGDTGEQGAKGDNGFSPVVTITDITGGHRITITDEAHPQGQSFDVMDGEGGGGGINFEVGVEKLYGTYTENGVTYQVYSKLLDIGALPSAAGAKQYPHGITGIKQILQINGFTNDGFVMNAPRQNAQDNISIYQAQKSGNIMVEVGKDRSSKNGFVMLIYAKNN